MQQKIKLNPSQNQRLAGNPYKSIWVSASAGTGKTKVLTDRILRILLNNQDASKILCLTFTKAASAEMSNRLFEKLKKWTAADEIELRKEILELFGEEHFIKTKEKPEDYFKTARKLFAEILDLPGGIKIQTIHGFCQSILKRFPIEAGISPNFSILDENEVKDILKEIYKNLLNNAEDLDPKARTDLIHSFHILAEEIHEINFNDLKKEIIINKSKFKDLFEKSDIDTLIKQSAKILGINPTLKKETIIKDAINFTDFNLIENILTETESSNTRDTKKLHNRLKNFIEKENKEENFDLYTDCFVNKKVREIRKTLFNKDIESGKPAIANLINKEADRVFEIENNIRKAEILKFSKAMLTIAKNIITKYEIYKKNRNIMDYEDLIQKTRKLFQNPNLSGWILYKLDAGESTSGIEHILIDEAQDTSSYQWEIANAIIENFFTDGVKKEHSKTLFVVGDKKQSIYSFQGADPEEFEKNRYIFKEKIEKNKFLWQDVSLNISFRSTRAVLGLVNELLKLPGAKEGVLSENEDPTHNAWRFESAGKIELWDIVEKEKFDTDEKDWNWKPPVETFNNPTAGFKMASLIAKKIKNMLDKNEILESTGKKIQPKDILILVQRRNNFINHLIKNLKQYNINVTGLDRLAISENIAVMDLLTLGKFTLLPSDDLNLATLLKSPLINITEEELFDICYKRKNTLWQSLTINKDKNECYKKAYNFLYESKNKAEKLSPFEFFNYILNAKEGKKKLLSRLGYDAEDAINEFINLTLQFEANNPQSMTNFIKWIETNEIEIKRDFDTNDDINAVKIMTVHGSKGLEAPIIFLPDTLRLPYNQSQTGHMFFNDDKFLWLPKMEYKDENIETYLEEKKNDALKEYRRLLYVALTRARDQLYITGYKNNTYKINEKSWYALIKEALENLLSKKEETDLKIEYTEDDFLNKQDEIKNKKIYKLTSPQIGTPEETKANNQEFFTPPLPDWINKEYTPDTNIKSITPSKKNEEIYDIRFNKQRFEQGKIIHKILELVFDLEPEIRNPKIEQILANKNLQKEIQNNIKETLKKFFDSKELKDFLPNKNDIIQSKSEVPITASLEDTNINAVIDKLILTKDEAFIIDYKTNKNIPKNFDEISPQYKRQMKLYKKLISSIYPNKKIKTALIYITKPKIISFPENF